MSQLSPQSNLDVLLLTNPAANRGRAQATGDEVHSYLTRAGYRVQHQVPEDISITRHMVDEAVSTQKRIIAVGGDGFIHHIVQGCAETGAILGIVPAGTGNDFAFGLDLPTSVEQATQAALTAPVTCDVLKFESQTGKTRYGASIATAGFSADVNLKAESMKWPRGSLKYTAATLLKLMRLKRYELQIAVDDAPIEGRCLMVAIANTRAFGGGMQIAPDAEPSSGTADLVVIRDSSALTLLRMLPKTFKGAHIKHPAVEVTRGTRFEVNLFESDSSEPCHLRADGEDVGSLPQTVTVVPGGLRVAGASFGHSPASKTRDTNE